ncbi:MAG: NPCBM/NEW2 domain-containing protein [Pirellulaceae bacterium]
MNIRPPIQNGHLFKQSHRFAVRETKAWLFLASLLIAACLPSSVSGQAWEVSTSNETISTPSFQIVNGVLSFSRKQLNIDDLQQIKREHFEALNDLSSSFIATVDGSTLTFSSIQIPDRVVMLEHNESRMEISRADLSTIVFTPLNADDKVQWNQLLSSPPESSDAIIVSREGNWRFVEGTIGTISEQGIEFTVGDQTANVPVNRIVGLYFFRREKLERPKASCSVHLRDGSTIFAQEILTLGKQFTITTTSSTVLQFSDTEIDLIDFDIRKPISLLSLEPTSVDWTPLLEQPQIDEYLRRINLPVFVRGDGSHVVVTIDAPLSNGVTETRTFDQGLQMRGGGRVAYSLDGNFNSISGIVGLSTETFGGNVKVTIMGDDQELWSAVLIDEDNSSESFDIALKSTGRLVIYVDYNDNRNTGDIVKFL